jgi:hypothetical protein
MALAARIHALLNRRPDEAEQVRRLRRSVASRLSQLSLDTGAGRERIAAAIAEQVSDDPISVYLAHLLNRLFEDEGYFVLPRHDEDMTTAELWAERDALKIQDRILAEFDRSMGTVEALVGTILPSLSASTEPSLFSTPIHAQIREFPKYLERLVQLIFAEEIEKADLFRALRARVTANLMTIDEKQVRLPTRHPSNDPLELLDAYLNGTPFPAFFTETVSLPVSEETFFSHMHVVGGSGAGKTQWLQTLILHHLEKDDPPALVVVDSQGDLINRLSHLALFDPDGGRLADRLVLITPKNIAHPPAINVFDIPRSRIDRYDQATREQVVAGVIETFDYLFSGLIGADLTAKQSVFFRFVARLLLALPDTMGRNATILDMIELMDDHTRYAEAIASLPDIQRRFFDRDFTGSTFRQTKEQIRYRLNAILENPTLERLFTSRTTKLDLFEELNRGSIILIDTAKDFLKGASGNFGRIFISLVLQAALERAAIPEHRRKPAFLIVDEAADYFDSNIDDLLTTVRKYKLGCVFAHQFLDQCTASLRASLAANTSIKLAGGLSMSDARTLAPDLRTTPDFILSQPRLSFACHIRNVTQTAISLPVSHGLLESKPKLSAAAYDELLRRNRERVALAPDEGPSPDTPGEGQPEEDGEAIVDDDDGTAAQPW